MNGQQLIHAGPNTATYPMDAGNTDQIKAWMMGAAAQTALTATNAAYQTYLNGPFATWLENYNAYRAELPPPGVPNGFDALMSVDGLDYELVAAETPSGPPPTYAPRLTATPSTTFTTGGAPAGLLFGAIGAQVKQKDGTTWVRIA